MNETQKTIIAGVRNGATRIAAARSAGHDPTWLAAAMADEDFAREVRRAGALACMELHEIVRAGVPGWPLAAAALVRRFPRAYGGRDAVLELEERSADGAPAWGAAAWMLAVRYPHHYGRCREEFRKPDRTGPGARSVDLAHVIHTIARRGRHAA